ncbi:ras GTPase-activating protein nGAP isoform X3 [Nematostella vectensis]|nr:ras GTPase-activating protein nGAP isoform X3 [Nematostella vectensis]
MGFSRKLAAGLRQYRTRSVSSFDDGDDELQGRSLSHGHLLISRSQESLFQNRSTDNPQHTETMESLDMSVSGKVSVRPIHPSILHRQHCFQVTSPTEVKYFSCRSAQELNKWVNSIKKSIQPARDQQNRMDISLSVWVCEAKGAMTTPKKRYFCELLLDKMLYARTTSKTKVDTLFWGENFSFNDLLDLSTITVNIYKDLEAKNKKEKRKLVGTVNIPVRDLDSSQEVEKWFPVDMTTKGNADSGSIRLKIKYQKIHILPLTTYNEMLSYLSNNYMHLCGTLESAVSSKVKDEIAGVILRVLQPVGKAQEFLVDIVMDEVNRLGSADENLVFRGNSFATKAMDTYMKMVGESYLQETLGDFVQSVYAMSEDCEVDPAKSVNGSIQSNQENLKAFAEKAWNHILCSSCIFPCDLQDTFHEFRQRSINGSRDLSNKLISASIFLRFLCPAIMSPSLFHLVQEYPNERILRTLTLIAKVIQNLANFTKFGGKEDYMGFMNDFVQNEFDKMREFVATISSPSVGRENRFEGSIDHGRELALLYNILKDQLGRLSKESLDKLSELNSILNSLEGSYATADHSIPNTAASPSRKWASSSDLISDQEKEKVTLTPVTPMKLSKSQTKELRDSHTSLDDWKKSVKRGNRALPTPQHLIVSPEDILASSPFDSESRRYSLPVSRDLEDMSNTSTGTLRRYSYLNAMDSADDFIKERNWAVSMSPRRGNGDFIHGFDSTETQESRVTAQKQLSQSYSSLDYVQRGKTPQRPWSMLIESPNGYNLPGSPKHAHTPQLITDLSRSASGTNLSRCSQKTSSLAIDDSLTRGNKYNKNGDESSPNVSPVTRRRSPNHSPKMLRTHREETDSLTRVNRTPSATSSSSSESSGSWPTSGFGSLDRKDDGSTIRTKRRQHKLPATPVEKPRRGSGSTTSSEIVPPLAEDELRDESPSGTLRQKTPDEVTRMTKNLKADEEELRRELAETKRVLASTHEQLILQESTTHKLVASFKERLAESEQNLRRVREEKEREVAELMEKLVRVENELARERRDMQGVTQAKQRIIDAQERRIRTLDASNARLVTTLNKMKVQHDKDKSNHIDNETIDHV